MRVGSEPAWVSIKVRLNKKFDKAEKFCRWKMLKLLCLEYHWGIKRFKMFTKVLWHLYSTWEWILRHLFHSSLHGHGSGKYFYLYLFISLRVCSTKWLPSSLSVYLSVRRFLHLIDYFSSCLHFCLKFVCLCVCLSVCF